MRVAISYDEGMLVNDLVAALERIAPPELAEPWDRVGLLVGSGSAPLAGPVLLTIDLTERVLDEAIALRAGAVIAYHPVIWEPLRRVTDATPRQRIVLRALRAGLAICSPHTALDAVSGGVTDWLCEGLSGSTTVGKVAGDCRALRPHGQQDAAQQVKIATFCPETDVDRVRSALASAGAGIIGNYQACSFVARGAGTFFGGPGSSPRVGEAGRFQEVAETRLEMVCSRAALPLALELLRRFHPYEEPAIDVYALEPKPRRHTGAGRRLVLDRPTSLRELADRLKKWLARPRMRFAPVGDENQLVTKLGVVPGAGSSLAADAAGEGCEVFVTGEMKHHEIIESLHAGMSIILGGHTNTERGYLPRLAERVRAELPGIETIVSTVDHDPVLTI